MSGSITARIQCTVEITVGVWGGGKSVDMDALTEQVRSEGARKLSDMIRKTGDSGRVIGTPKVLFVLLGEGGVQS